MAGATFLYDGDCAFCSSCARFAVAWIAPSADVVAWQQAPIDRLGVTPQQADDAVQWVDDRGVRSAGPVAIAELLRTGRWWARPLGGLLRTGPVLRLGWPAYRWVADHRDKMPGGTPTCGLPQHQRSDPPR